MLRRDKIILGIAAVQFAVAGLWLASGRASGSSSVPPPEALLVSSSAAIGAKGSLRGNASRANESTTQTYTLVEFGDYECPPCAASHPQVMALLKRHPDTLRLQFRHLPLESIHPLARRAAIAAEIARPAGRFWTMHDTFYQNRDGLSERALLLLETASDKEQAAAETRVESDIADAKRLGVNRTPTFLLCRPDGQVLKLGSVKQAEIYLP